MQDIMDLNLLIRSCMDCELHKLRNNTVPGSGSLEPQIMFIGEGPGYHEDRGGKPFSGSAGQFLDELLESIELTREDVFITNMIKCRAPDNRDPRENEMQSCSKYLDRQIELINPKLIVTLGRFSTAKFIKFNKITSVRGKVVAVDGRFILPIMHPASGLYKSQWKYPIMADFKKIPGIMLQPRPRKVEPTQQMSML